MSDITNTHLEAAFIDQMVAGAFHGKAYAYTAVAADRGFQLAVAAANERGYTPVAGKTFTDKDEAWSWAKQLNEHIGLSDDRATRIVISSMGYKPYEATA